MEELLRIKVSLWVSKVECWGVVWVLLLTFLLYFCVFLQLQGRSLWVKVDSCWRNFFVFFVLFFQLVWTVGRKLWRLGPRLLQNIKISSFIHELGLSCKHYLCIHRRKIVNLNFAIHWRQKWYRRRFVMSCKLRFLKLHRRKLSFCLVQFFSFNFYSSEDYLRIMRWKLSLLYSICHRDKKD